MSQRTNQISGFILAYRVPKSPGDLLFVNATVGKLTVMVSTSEAGLCYQQWRQRSFN